MCVRDIAHALMCKLLVNGANASQSDTVVCVHVQEEAKVLLKLKCLS